MSESKWGVRPGRAGRADSLRASVACAGPVARCAVRRCAMTAGVVASVVTVGMAGCRDDAAEPGAMHGVGGFGGSDSGPRPTELKLRFQSMSVPGAADATDFVFLPGSQEMLLTTSKGELVHAVLEGDSVRGLKRWGVEEATLTEAACGPTNVLLDPEFADNGFVYITYCVDESVTHLARHRWSARDGLGPATVIFETVIEEPQDLWHRFGSIGFEPDGRTLWALSGDHFLSREAQDPRNPLGAVLRIVPDRSPDGAGHTYPEGNMADDDETIHPAVFAYGLRSPWRGTRDSQGRLWIAEVGLGKVEEINLLTEVGQNFGWPTYEGPCRVVRGEGGAPSDEPCEGFVDPIAHHTREGDDPYLIDDPLAEPAVRRAIWLGQIYEKPARDRYAGLMDGVVVFGEFYTGWVRALRVNARGEVTFDRPIGHLVHVTQWRTGPDGYAYALDIHGVLHRAQLEIPEEATEGASR